MTKKIIIALAVVVAVVSGVLYGRGLLSVHQGLTPPPSLSVLALEKAPKPAPAVGFSDASGKHYTLADFKGRYVLLNLWATWCAPCVGELPALARLQGQVAGLRVIPVNTLDHNPGDLKGFLKSHNAGTLPLFRDTDSVMAKGFGAYGLPMTVLIDPQGKVVAKAAGPAEWASPEAVAYFKRITGS